MCSNHRHELRFYQAPGFGGGFGSRRHFGDVPRPLRQGRSYRFAQRAGVGYGHRVRRILATHDRIGFGTRLRLCAGEPKRPDAVSRVLRVEQRRSEFGRTSRQLGCDGIELLIVKSQPSHGRQMALQARRLQGGRGAHRESQICSQVDQ